MCNEQIEFLKEQFANDKRRLRDIIYDKDREIQSVKHESEK